MSPERPENDDFLEDEEQDEYSQRSIFATGWFRAVLVLLILAVIAVIAVPLIGGWFEPTPPPKVVTKPSDPPPTVPAPTPTPPAAQAPTPPPAAAPATPPSPPSAQAPSPPATATPQPPPALPPATSMPKGESLAAPGKSAEKAKPSERVAAATPGKSASRPATTGSYWVQVGAFKESRNAEGLAKTLRAEGFAVQVSTVTRDTAMHVVRVGGYPDRSKASAAREELQGKGHAGFVTQGPAK